MITVSLARCFLAASYTAIPHALLNWALGAHSEEVCPVHILMAHKDPLFEIAVSRKLFQNTNGKKIGVERSITSAIKSG